MNRRKELLTEIIYQLGNADELLRGVISIETKHPATMKDAQNSLRELISTLSEELED